MEFKCVLNVSLEVKAKLHMREYSVYIRFSPVFLMISNTKINLCDKSFCTFLFMTTQNKPAGRRFLNGTNVNSFRYICSW